ncbi:MAG TPA: alpha-glucan family phosphorylase [Porticoccaceae bacterium]|nr:alpha-glucan family phosphorylase [Porticoccaceae bacterium]
MSGQRFNIEIQPRLPVELRELEPLADNLLYSWDRGVRGLFHRLDAELWESCGHNPKVFLRRIAQERLDSAAADPVFLQDFRGVLSAYSSYLEFRRSHERGRGGLREDRGDLVSYACAEFGLHESFPIYSGGLGILAGDYCKAMSDMDVPFVAVGMLYRQGYFRQTIDAEGNQIAHYHPSRIEDLPVRCAGGERGPLIVAVPMAERVVQLRVWVAQVGLIRLFLLDSDIDPNSREDRAITYQLYGGGETERIRQEIVLGIGSVRAQRALGLAPRVWHINEGHAAFQIIERCRELVAGGLDFDTALEAVAADTVFTTHTPVPAGHDRFDRGLIEHYLGSYIAELGINLERFLALGASPDGDHLFNMTALALRGSRFHNGVSAIHGGVASRMEAYAWPEIAPEENPIGHVTNGIHVPTFLAREWVSHFNQQLGGGWRNELCNPGYWRCIDDIPGHVFWSLRNQLKAKLADALCDRLGRQLARNGHSPTQIGKVTRYLQRSDRNVMMIGFGRRFATYKRATLIFADPERLARLLNDPQRPVVLVFAGKAHPADRPGQELIRALHRHAAQPEFEGRVLLVEDYDIALARKLVTGVDVWLNTPRYPQEASGTSGQKAAINGVVNLSVLDGWWAEGYSGDNGWAIAPHCSPFSTEFCDREEAAELLDLLEREVIPLYFEHNSHGYSRGWVRRAKAAMKTIIPRFNAERMVADYLRQYYVPARDHGQRLAADDWAGARALVRWKQRALAGWPEVRLALVAPAPSTIFHDERLRLRVAVTLGTLAPEDVVVECVLGRESATGEFETVSVHPLHHDGRMPDGRTQFTLDLQPSASGLLSYQIRIYPWHRLLAHPFELGRMRWL